jgi:diguanylate cyclase (GGDEF)-like protein
MTRPAAAPPESSENPQFALANTLMANYIGALGLLIETQDRADRMEEMAKVDPVTGLFNIYKLEEDYEGLRHSHGLSNSKHERATDRDPEEVTDEHSILMLDLDHFKKINDNGGHARGDRVLGSVGATLKSNLRGSDLPVRLHGEEFAVLLPRTSTEQAVKVAEGLRAKIEAGGEVTASIGVAGIDLQKLLDSNLANADAALYAAKDNGRNQVVLFDPTMLDDTGDVLGPFAGPDPET